MPVAETFGLAAQVRSATSGYAFWQSSFDHWAEVPQKIAPQIISEFRARKGLPKDVPKLNVFVDET
jgi:elongation factor 2